MTVIIKRSRTRVGEAKRKTKKKTPKNKQNFCVCVGTRAACVHCCSLLLICYLMCNVRAWINTKTPRCTHGAKGAKAYFYSIPFFHRSIHFEQFQFHRLRQQQLYLYRNATISFRHFFLYTISIAACTHSPIDPLACARLACKMVQVTATHRFTFFSILRFLSLRRILCVSFFVRSVRRKRAHVVMRVPCHWFHACFSLYK